MRVVAVMALMILLSEEAQPELVCLLLAPSHHVALSADVNSRKTD